MDSVCKFKVAHLNAKGVDLILVPLASAFGQLKRLDQEKAIKTLQHYAAAAGLRGFVVPIWDKGAGKAEFLAEKQLLPILQNFSLAVVQQNLNRELSVKRANLGSLAGLVGPSAADAARTGIVECTSDVDDAQVFVDGCFVGNIGGRIRVAEGHHVVEVKAPGYQDWKQEVQVTAGSQIQLRASLEIEPAFVSDALEPAESDNAREHRGKVAAFQRKHRIGLVTLMFTDMVGSTKLKQELGDREAVKLIQSHHSEFRNLLRNFPGGEEISTAGDSFFIVFAKPSDAVKFALQIQARLRRWSKERGGVVRDRIGIHVGEVFIEEVGGSGQMNDLYGIQVDTCARVMSLAHGDQILMTRFAFDNARQVLKGQPIEGVTELVWKTHGDYLMKGVEDPMEICEVGERAYAVLAPPEDSEKAKRFSTMDCEPGSAGQPAPPPHSAPAVGANQHVVVSTKSSFPLKPLRFPAAGQ